MWKAAGVYFNTKSPLVVVLSESMSPGFERGDILFIRNDLKRPVRKGDITVFELKGKDIPIVHRALKIHELYPNYIHYIICTDVARMGLFVS
jgi:signal peptidase